MGFKVGDSVGITSLNSRAAEGFGKGQVAEIIAPASPNSRGEECWILRAYTGAESRFWVGHFVLLREVETPDYLGYYSAITEK